MRGIAPAELASAPAAGSASAQTFTASQSNYSGSFTSTTPSLGQPNSCSGIVTVAQNSSSQFTVTPVAAGTCVLTIAGGNGQSAPLSVVVTTTTVGGS